MKQSSVFLLVATDGYSIDHTKYSSLELAKKAMNNAYNNLYNENMDKDWKEQSYIDEESAILFQNGENVYVWDIIEVPFKN